LGSGRTLLIVGEPGSGKTIALLKLAEDALDRTEPDLRQQIPVVFNLSSWARKPQSIEQWLIQELLEKYQVSKALGKTWVESEALMLLLDGLDEVKAEQRNACVQALNQFMQTHGTTEIVICCRIGDYQMLQDRLMLRSAICLQPLTATQIDRYFEQAGDRLSALKAVLPQDAELQELAKSPLMLSVMSLAYQDFAPEQLTVGGKIEDYRKRLFATYIDRMFQRRGTTQQYSREDSQRWLIWLAQRMTVASQAMFSIERLQPTWLPTKGQRIRYRIESGCIGGLSFGLISGLSFRLRFGLISGLRFGLTSVVIGGLSGGLSSAVRFGLTSGLIYGLWVVVLGDIQPVETLKWSGKELRNHFIISFIGGSSIGLILGFLIDGLIGGLIGFLIAGLISVVIGGFRGFEIHQSEKANQGIFRSAQNAAIIAISSFLICELMFGIMYGLIFGLMFGLTFGLIYGGNACIRHFVLRLALYRKGYAPWNYARFLDYATERLFMQKVGGSYIFVHRMLLEHFAKMSIEQEKH
jgi:hypothetical protein